jgi:uncharacterized repeat protein (TIGR04138 family)
MGKEEGSQPAKSLLDVVNEVAIYPPEAFEFVRQGLSYTVLTMHGPGQAGDESATRHVNGRELCHGLRDYAHRQFGMMAGAVLARWNLTSTMDFGRIVFALVDNGFMQKTDHDLIDDFKDVFSFREAFAPGSYRISLP